MRMMKPLGMQNYPDLNSGVTGSTEWTMGGAANPATGDWAADVYDGGMNDYPDAMTGTFDAERDHRPHFRCLRGNGGVTPLTKPGGGPDSPLTERMPAAPPV